MQIQQGLYHLATRRPLGVSLAVSTDSQAVMIRIQNGMPGSGQGVATQVIQQAGRRDGGAGLGRSTIYGRTGSAEPTSGGRLKGRLQRGGHKQQGKMRGRGCFGH